jgi:hypothetical protein
MRRPTLPAEAFRKEPCVCGSTEIYGYKPRGRRSNKHCLRCERCGRRGPEGFRDLEVIERWNEWIKGASV